MNKPLEFSQKRAQYRATMKRILAAFCLLSLTMGCKKKDSISAGDLIPIHRTCTAPTFYTGAIAPTSCLGGGAPPCTHSLQTVSINTDPTNQMDIVHTVLCRNADCDTTVPTTICSTLPPSDTTTPCKTLGPNVYITYGNREIEFVSADAAGFDHYLVSTEICTQ